ncbi:MAG: Peptidase U32 [Parcubacteria group bacterium GW2011_GWC2_39_14]|nr:MAG: Peptidase U32 [Parcubacteria group bacterium GW2011_GWC2_39_14]KKR54330.1 MAG: Peptidase U32 [Parcubacteria group bacterium GW2011_GWA2_40_23]
MNKPELLAPAGNLKKLQYALEFGADAVYCGIPDFSLRVRINQFDLKSLKVGIDYAHQLGKKVYVTTNIFAHNKHLEKLEKHLKLLKTLKPDALIVSDPGVIKLAQKICPKIEIHLSTQVNCTNWQAAKFWYEQGVKRIILGREVTLKEIKEIHKKVPKVQLEVFVHGAMCMSYSGRCLLSKYYTNRSANLGDCTQPCRWQFRHFIGEVTRPDDLLEIEEDDRGTYIMNSRDLCLIEYLDQLKKAGVMSFKIEGRAKSIYYLANTVKVYREVIDAKKTIKNFKPFIEELKKTQNRGYTKGFLFGKEEVEQEVNKSHDYCPWEFCGEVIDYKNGQAKVLVHNQFKVRDTLELIPPCGNNFEYRIKNIEDKKYKKMEEAHGGQETIVYLDMKDAVAPMTLLRRRLSKKALKV